MNTEDQKIKTLLIDSPDISFQEFESELDTPSPKQAFVTDQTEVCYYQVVNLEGIPILSINFNGEVYHRGKLIVSDPELSRILKKVSNLYNK